MITFPPPFREQWGLLQGSCGSPCIYPGGKKEGKEAEKQWN